VENDNEPNYKTKIAWNSNLYSDDDGSITVDGGSVYFYERPPGLAQFNNIYNLTKLDAKTGKLIWRSNRTFRDVKYCQPVVIGGFVYVFLYLNIIVCFNSETGTHTATVAVDIENKNLELEGNAIAYGQYIYMGLWKNGQYFVRLNVNSINHTGDPDEIQKPAPETLWEEEVGKLFFCAVSVVHDNIVYVNTTNPLAHVPVEIMGFDLETKKRVFHVSFGDPEDVGLPFPETGGTGGANPLLIHDGVLYFLNLSISAWDLTSKEQLYCHTFNYNIPEPQWYLADRSLQAVYYQNKIFYISGVSYLPDRFRNIHCIDAKTGKLVWNDIAKDSASLETNPIIAHGKLYVSQYTGLRVYEAETGKLTGVDKSFCGADMGRNVLYEDKDYMICVRKDRNTGDGKVVAVYVGK
jgi:outer membrane protein assembly factor BamB